MQLLRFLILTIEILLSLVVSNVVSSVNRQFSKPFNSVETQQHPSSLQAFSDDIRGLPSGLLDQFFPGLTQEKQHASATTNIDDQNRLHSHVTDTSTWDTHTNRPIVITPAANISDAHRQLNSSAVMTANMSVPDSQPDWLSVLPPQLVDVYKFYLNQPTVQPVPTQTDNFTTPTSAISTATSENKPDATAPALMPTVTSTQQGIHPTTNTTPGITSTTTVVAQPTAPVVIVRNFQNVKPFNGTSSVRSFKDHFERVSAVNNPCQKFSIEFP